MQYITEQHQLEPIIPELMKYQSWGLDTETTGLSPHDDRVTLLQLGRPEAQYVIDTRKVSIESLRPFLENRGIFKILHNAKFDYKMLRGSFGIEMEAVRCTFLAEQVLNAGRKFSGFSLGAVVQARLGVAMDKDLQKSFIGHTGDFSQEQLQYAANDVAHLIPLYKHQLDEMRPLNLHHTCLLECEAIQAFGDMEFDGQLIDAVAWKALMQKHMGLAAETKKAMNEVVEPFAGTDLFGQVDINYGSPAQMTKLLNQMRFKIQERNPETGKEESVAIKKTDKKTLMKLRDKPFIQLLQKWRSYQIRVTTFGQPYLDAINPKTGCIHSNLFQIGTETGRPAAGDSAVNPLNVPRENAFRHCFICQPDELVESDDFAGCESRILAEISGDQKLIDIFLKGEDIHCTVATTLYGKLVTKTNENKALRTPAKALNFGVAYGMASGRLYDELNGQGFPVTRVEARALFDKYCYEYATAVNYLRDMGKLAAKQGYLANLNGRRRYWHLPDHHAFKDGYRDPEYMGKIGNIERAGGNFMIQSVNADMTKKAMTDVRNYRKKNKVRTKFVNAVYDELVTRTHKDDSPSFHAEKLRLMRAAGEHWVKKIPMLVDGAVHPYWTKG